MVGVAEAMHGQFLQHLAHASIRDVHARGDEPQEDSLLEKLGRNPFASLEAGGGTPLVPAWPQPIALGNVTKSPISSEKCNLSAFG